MSDFGHRSADVDGTGEGGRRPAAAHSATLPMLDAYLSMMRAAALVSAGEIGLFETLSGGRQTIGELAQQLDMSEVGLTSLTDYLVSVGYLQRQGSFVANAPFATRWFSSLGEVDYTPGLVWTGEAWGLMRSLSDAVGRGGPHAALWQIMTERAGVSGAFSSYMHAFAEHLSDDLLKAIHLPANASRLLDLGGSHGIHSIALCERCPDLQAVIADLASALTFTQDLIARKGMSDRISLLPGDLNDSDWGADYDIILYLSVAHNQTKTENARTFKRMWNALRPGGVVVVHDYMADDGLEFHKAFQLTLLVETGTSIYSYDEYAGWLCAAGFERPVRTDLDPREKGTLLVARRPLDAS
jgi:hypothetical protein